MGAIEREGYIFEMEYSEISKKGALHVYLNGECIEEMPFHYTDDVPSHSKVEMLIDQFLESKQN
ncbi:hypothetical protein CIB95_07720 [Lottiidibacillus patelloidae]|uniref:Uncharacterized protein n=1 Tax=Lottiidibacillus patelloidae TaxID=2670334 RepID=A0A263BUX5_9BACI|nr:DUF5370 family protein [Lottiidibacillus patelloidae]OZM57510.1 hypothetical protein CIB95_07720 [Lottiidibacillus patelloidae]